MEIFNQVRLLLRRNVALRLRQPIILALELLWPVAIFLVVMSTRIAIPPVAQQTCHYKAWALPSAGVVSFVQSMICNIDECQNKSEYESIPTYKGSSVQELVSNTLPLIMDESITELVQALPKGMRLMRVAVDALSGPDLSALLDDGFPVRNLLKDSNQTREILQKINLTDEEIENILNSSIQLPQILELLNQNNFCDTSQDSESYSTELLTKLVKRLCNLDSAGRKEFFGQLKNQLDVKNIVKTMGLAMSELGRLDISKILENIGGLLVSLQSSNILQEDVLSTVTNLLEEIQFDQIDTEVLSDLINDLEPLYKDSDWSSLIYILKDLDLPMFKGKNIESNKRIGDAPSEAETPAGDTVVVSSNNSENTLNSLQENDTTPILNTVLSLIETGVNILRIVPHKTSSQAHKAINYIKLLTDLTDDVENALKNTNSSEFIDTAGDLLGAFFLTVVDSSKLLNGNSTAKGYIDFCNVDEFQKKLNSSKIHNANQLQHYACRIAELTEKMLDSNKNSDKENLHVVHDKLKQILSKEKYISIYQNLQKWATDSNSGIDHSSFSKYAYKNESIDDLISVMECGAQQINGVIHPNFEDESKIVSPNSTSFINGLNNLDKDKFINERNIVLAILKMKDIMNYFKLNPLFASITKFFKESDTVTILTELEKVMNAAKEGNNNFLPAEILRLLPALIFATKDLKTGFSRSIAELKSLPSIVSLLVDDIEPFIWNSISPKMVRDFSDQKYSRNFCIDTNTLEATQLHWKWMLCEDSLSAFRLPLPTSNEETIKINDSRLPLKLDLNLNETLDAKVFSRMTLQVSSQVGFLLKTVLQFLKPVKGCENTCTADAMLKKMCFLSRMQNVKKILQDQETGIAGVESDDILQQLQHLFPVDEKIIESYDTFMDATRFSAQKNYTDWKDIVKLLVSSLQFLESVDGKSQKLRPVFHVLTSLTSLIKNRVSDAAQSAIMPMVRIENVLPDSPLTQEVVKSFLPLLPEVASTFFWTSLAPGKLLDLVEKSKKNISIIMSELCDSSLTKYLYNPALNEDEFAKLGEALCHHEYYDLFEEIFQDPDIQEIVFEASSTDEISWEDMNNNILETVTLLMDLSTAKRADLSLLPPLEKWQKMAMDVQTYAQDPSVILYILSNKLFYGFCTMSTQSVPSNLQSFFPPEKEAILYRELCSMSEPSFSYKLVDETEKRVLPRVRGKEIDYGSAVQEIGSALLRMSPIRSILDAIFDLDLSADSMENGDISSDSNYGEHSNEYVTKSRRRIMTAIKKAFSMVNSLTNEDLSGVILGSSAPELLQEFSSFILETGGKVDLKHFFKNGNEGSKLLLTLFQSNPEKQRLERYVKVLKSFFTKPDNYETLKTLCDIYRDKQKSKVSQETVNTVFEMMCIDSPRKWSIKLLMTPMNNFSELWYQIDELLSEDIKNQTREDYFKERKEDMWTSIENILKSGIHLNDVSSVQSPQFYFSLLKSVIRNLDESGMNLTIPGIGCFTRTKQHAIQNSTHKLLRSIPDAEFLTCGLLNKNISSFYRWFSHSSGLKNTIQQFTEEAAKDERCKHSWNWLLPLVDDLENFYLRISMDLSESDVQNIKNCLQNMKQSVLLQSIETHANIMQKAAKFMMSLGTPTGQFKEIKQQLLKKISQHLPAYFKIPDLVQNQTSYSSPDELDQELMDALKDTAINFNLLRRQGFSAEMFWNKICKKQRYSGSFYPSSATLYSRSKMKEILCKSDNIEKVLSYLEKEDIKNKIRESQERDFFSGLWLQNLIGSSGVLIDVVRKLGSFLSEIKIQSIYDVFQLFTKPQVIQNVADSFEKLTDVFEPIFPDSSLTETLHQIKDGLKAFKSLSQLANFSFLYDPQDMFRYDVEQILLTELMVDPKLVSKFVESKIDLKQAKMIPDSDKVSFCKGPSDDSILCILSNYNKTTLSAEHLQDLVFQRFLYSFGTLGIEGVLKEAEVDAQEASKTLSILSNAPAIVNKLTSHLETVTEVMIPEVKLLFRQLEEGTDWIATPEAMAVGGQILCGKPLTSLSRRFQLLAPSETENKIEEKELLRLPTDFCRHGYKEIMKMRGGAILWGFLKPLFRGKILFSPKSYEPALHIIAKINETFNSLEEQMKFIKAAAEGSTGLHYLQRKNETLSSLQKFFASNAVSRFIKSSSWGAALSWLDAPNTSSRSLLHLVELVGNVTECISLDRFIGFDSETELEAAAATLHDRREFIAAIVFVGDEETDPNQPENTIRISEYLLPKKVSYKIRMDIDNVPTTEYIKYRWWRPYPYDDFFEDLRYFRGFIQLQDTIDDAIINIQTGSIEDKSVKKYLQQFPYPCHQSDKWGTLLKGIMPAIMTISWIFIVAFLVRERVLGRELELDETLRVMGLKKISAWMAWFLTGLAVLFVSVIGIVAVLKWGGITPLSDVTILFLFVADFAILLIAYCQLMSTFFKRASTAALLSVLLYVLSFFPFLLFVTWELDFLYWHKLLSCVLVSTSFCFGCLYLSRYEDQGQGIHWSNLWLSPENEDRMNFGTTLVAMALCALVYFFIALYVGRISLGYKTKKPLPWYFMLPSPSIKDDKVFESSLSNSQKKAKKALEAGDQKAGALKKVGISIENVHAVYSKKGSKEWKALSGLNIELYEDHITALLGHNGAGKTTTIKLLTGRIPPTSGNIKLYDLDIPQQLPLARKMIGFCPQNNTLYDKLTVKEHLYLFAHLKGQLDAESIEKDVEGMVRNLNLVDKQHECSEKLSGGQRRRLCVGIAFIGGSKIIILDEPTSSVDPVARRSIWDLILKYKKGRTILFTTHHLDEADILSDRVAILHKGRMLCSDSPLQLKVRFGSGYRLSLFPGSEKLERDDRDSGRASSLTGTEDLINVDSDGIMEFIQGYVPDATLLENDDSHLVVSLPAEPLTTKPLSEFFAHLQKCLHLWGFNSCSLSSATLEEVFLTLCRLEDAKVAHSSDKYHDTSPFRVQKASESIFFKGNENNNPKNKPVAIEMTDSNYTESSYFCLKYNQMWALLRKRYWHTKKNWKALLSSIVMPCVFIALAMGLAVGRPQKPPDPSIQLNPELYSTKDHKTVSFYSWGEPTPFLGSTLLHTLRTNYSGAEICNRELENCQYSKAESFLMKDTSPKCLCERECPANVVAPTYSFSTRDQIVFNLSDIDIPQYILDSFLQFNERRYGGWTIEESNSDEDVIKTWFENSGYHAAPSYLNTINNAILKGRTGYDFDIQTWSHPLRLSVEQLGRESLLERLAEVGIAFVFLIGLSLVPCTFATYIVGERQSEQKRLQMVTGAIGPLLYWSVAFIWDIGIVFFTSLISAAIVGSFALPAFYQRDNFKAVYTLIFLYGWATTPITYFCSRFFKEGSLAFMVVFTSHLFIGLVIMFALVSLRMISISKDVTSTLEVLQKFSLIFPQYSLVGGLTDLNENQIRTEIFEQFGQDIYASPFKWNSLGPNFVALFLQGIIFFLLTVLIEIVPWRYWYQRLIFGKRPMNQEVVPSIEDPNKYLLQIQDISQVYHTKAGRKYAVDNLTLNIPVGECFGLVGANGAGKTTLFRILIGQIQPTSGKIISAGLESRTSRKERFLGYCPQKDALDGLLTPRQHLTVYAGLRGIPAKSVATVVEHCLESLELDAHADRPVNALSGGTKRKLCTSIATLGDPELVLLDEPTSGMDPATRRLVWKNISQITESGRSVILTSHSIEDCDVLCSRLGIMVNGKIACLDNPSKLKSRLGTGYTLSFRMTENFSNHSSLINFIQEGLPTARIQVHSGRRIELTLPDENVSLSNLFCQLEECAKEFGMEDLAIDPTTLDQVFVNFVRQQSDSLHTAEGEKESFVMAEENLEICCTKL